MSNEGIEETRQNYIIFSQLHLETLEGNFQKDVHNKKYKMLYENIICHLAKSLMRKWYSYRK